MTEDRIAARSRFFRRNLPQSYRDEMQAMQSPPLEEDGPATESILLFTLGSACFALPTRIAGSVTPSLHISRIPHRTGTALLGIVAIRGELMPCCSLAELCNLDAAGGAHAQMLVLEEHPGRNWVVPIDKVIGIFTDRPIAALRAGTDLPVEAGWLLGSILCDGNHYFLLNSIPLFRQMQLATA